MKRRGFQRPSYAEWLAKQKDKQQHSVAVKTQSRASLSKESSVKKQFSAAKIASQLRTKQNRAEQGRLEAIFKAEVRKRDSNECRFPGCHVRQKPGLIQIIDVHHIATRKRRPDLILVVTNGICLCNINTNPNHHGYVHLNPIEAVEMELLSDRSRELAEKEGTLGVR